MKYESFIAEKGKGVAPSGFKPGPIHPRLYDWQVAITKWAIQRGTGAIFADCGLGKTLMQVAWADQVQKRTGGKVLIVAPLCVAGQTIREAATIGVEVEHVTEPTDAPFQIVNYEKLHKFADADYVGIVLDESSILKSLDGRTRTLLLDKFTDIPFRLCCTATPAPNDISELGNHCQFLGVLTRAEMLATYFVHDGALWRLKGHAMRAFYEWMASWSVFIRLPEDVGFNNDGFVLPDLNIVQQMVTAHLGDPPTGELFARALPGLRGRRQARRASLDERVDRVANLIQASKGEQWVVWCGLNDEGRMLAKAIGNASVLVEGKDSDATKMERELSWRNGEVQVLISKPRIFGFGMNWQHCRNVAFLGLGDSYEQYYQAIRRTWRFGQTRPVDVHVVVSQLETNVVSNIKRKQVQAQRMADEVIRYVGDIEKAAVRGHSIRNTRYETEEIVNDEQNWHMMMGDCVDKLDEIEPGSVGLSVFSPPFASLYTYSASARDMGNCKDYDEFMDQYRFMIPKLLKATMPGRRCCTHIQQVAMKKSVDGFIGWRDFRADVVREMVAGGWIYDGEVVIDKNPQTQAIRTKSKQLMFVQLHKDSSWVRPAMADYILLFRARGENPEAVKTDIDNELWIQWARPVWTGIRETNTLSVAEARDEKDERHLCPLQLETIERCVRLWSNKGDLILSPFAGIGSEGYVALKHGRRFIGIELKRSYYETACKNLKRAVPKTLFDKAV